MEQYMKDGFADAVNSILRDQMESQQNEDMLNDDSHTEIRVLH
ncbi:hypothetical protein PSI15_14115 [Xenorhabdus sp. PR6a]|nr:hypothetical protein [Xenorhabdus sp. PR6a]MDC9582686.1 hypothetical protein [Xenorhabdus sp. PR6a]